MRRWRRLLGRKENYTFAEEEGQGGLRVLLVRDSACDLILLIRTSAALVCDLADTADQSAHLRQLLRLRLPRDGTALFHLPPVRT